MFPTEPKLLFSARKLWSIQSKLAGEKDCQFFFSPFSLALDFSHNNTITTPPPWKDAATNMKLWDFVSFRLRNKSSEGTPSQKNVGLLDYVILPVWTHEKKFGKAPYFNPQAPLPVKKFVSFDLANKSCKSDPHQSDLLWPSDPLRRLCCTLVSYRLVLRCVHPPRIKFWTFWEAHQKIDE